MTKERRMRRGKDGGDGKQPMDADPLIHDCAWKQVRMSEVVDKSAGENQFVTRRSL
ncbi:4-diphosphocytidyl-2C-methyl-D-erythritol kinase [Geobacillus sp. LEMMJ02]|nr:4-diphosphocytidyl-2C-methyl-D-erythritol kinase [Geobacillus kaustophilus NBRC 102445]TLS31805.1 4-diphosphocytidyl-2C-methyl-D-erythritol kinase [Geobacillus thermoleovorans]TRY39316.1 4-diphosphocytidyl-2C-methyl-D-erythritol kinase [Geobacillus sp. LEMMJ02]